MKRKHTTLFALLAALLCWTSSCSGGAGIGDAAKEPVDYVNPYMGNISHLLVPTFPTVQLPNSLLRVYPERADFTGDRLNGLPIIVTNHRERSAFNLSPYQGDEAGLTPVVAFSYDQEQLRPYRYQVYLDDAEVEVDFAPSQQSAVYGLRFAQQKPTFLVFNTRNGELKAEGNAVSGYQFIDRKTKIYLYAETDQHPVKAVAVTAEGVQTGAAVEGQNVAVALAYGEGVKQIGVRYGVSLISAEQAKANLEREIAAYDVDVVAKSGRNTWNEAWGKIKVKGVTT